MTTSYGGGNLTLRHHTATLTRRAAGNGEIDKGDTQHMHRRHKKYKICTADTQGTRHTKVTQKKQDTHRCYIRYKTRTGDTTDTRHAQVTQKTQDTQVIHKTYTSESQEIIHTQANHKIQGTLGVTQDTQASQAARHTGDTQKTRHKT